MTDRLWNEVEAALRGAALLHPRQAQRRNTATPSSPTTGPIRADLLGNMWAQEWGNIYDVVAPQGAGDIGYDLDRPAEGQEVRRRRRWSRPARASTPRSASRRCRRPSGSARRSRSPRDREVICHASAWDVDNKDDLRIKMCTKVNADDFVTIHHELGPQFLPARLQPAALPLSERRQRRLPRGDRRLHRAVGHARISGADRPARSQQGAGRRARTPACCCARRWTRSRSCRSACWSTNGAGASSPARSTPANYNQAWVDLRAAVSGHRPAGRARREADFDPGAKYHIPANTPYARYFLARILQFQFYKAACDRPAGRGRSTAARFYGNKEVGAAAERRCWRWAHRSPGRTRSRRSPAAARCRRKPMVEYFAPLQTWLEEQNRGKQCGW